MAVASRTSLLALVVALSPAALRADNLGLRGSIEPEARVFTNSASSPRQTNLDMSIASEVTAKYVWDKGNQSLVFTPFARLDQRDDHRTHWDLREARYGLVMGKWEMRLGFDKVFWGVTEAVHLVDIVNQVDIIEDPVKQEARLGQPMLRIRTTQDFGTFDAFLLPYFRERDFRDRTAGRLSIFPSTWISQPMKARARNAISTALSAIRTILATSISASPISRAPTAIRS